MMKLKHALLILAVPALTALTVFADGDIPAAPLGKGNPAVCSLVNLSAAKEYPRGINPKRNPGMHFTYGLEVEYALSEVSPQLFDDYAPESALYPRAAWHALSPEMRRAWVTQNLHALFPEGTRKPGRFVRIIEDKDLPERLIMDETGNLELIGPEIFSDRLSFWRFMEKVEAKYGRGYVQASVGIPAQAIYRSVKSTGEYLGKLFFVGQRDTLQKLHAGYAKHLETPAYVPAKSFTHPFLGPMITPKANFLRNVMYKARQNKVTDDTLDLISATDASYKYTSQVVYRPDIVRGKKLFLAEARDCVTDFDCLKRRMLREIYFHSIDLKPFAAFEEMRTLDPVGDFMMFSDEIKEMFERALPRNLHREDEAEILITDVARNFAFPGQEWAGLFEAMGYQMKDRPYQTAKKAVGVYETELQHTAEAFLAGKIDGKTAINRCRISLAKFAYDSKILDEMDEFLRKSFPGYTDLEAHF